jgi:hypothetical protein
MKTINTLKRVLGATLVVGTAVLAIGTTSVHAQESGVTEDNRPRIERACARIQKATDAGRTDLAAALTNRRAVREASLPVLELRKANLVEFEALCAKALAS